MNRKYKISVVYKHYIPEELISELGVNLKSVGIKFTKTKDEEKYHNFTGPELSDIVIYIKDNPITIFLAPALYDVVKSSIIFLWKNLLLLPISKIRANRKKEPKKKKLSIRYEDDNKRRIEINLEGEIDDEILERIVDDSLNLMQPEIKDQLFDNIDFVDNSGDFKRVEYTFNPISKSVELTDFQKLREDNHKLMDRIRKDLSS